MNIKKLPKSIGVMLLYFFSSIFSLVPIIIFNLKTDNLSSFQSILIEGYVNIVLILFLFIIYRKDLIEDFKKLKTNFSKNFDKAILYWLIGLGIMMVTNIIIGLLFNKASANNENTIQELIKESGVISIIVFGILGPFIEEIVFRKTFRDVIKNDLAFVLIAGIFFGSVHVVFSLQSAWDLLYLIPYCALGISFTKIYQKTNNIFYSIFIHMIHNTILVTLSVIGAYLGVVLW